MTELWQCHWSSGCEAAAYTSAPIPLCERHGTELRLRHYYEQDGITIYHGDCLDVLPRLKGSITSSPIHRMRLKRIRCSGGQAGRVEG